VTLIVVPSIRDERNRAAAQPSLSAPTDWGLQSIVPKRLHQGAGPGSVPALRAQEQFSTKSAQDLRLRAAAIALTVGRTLLLEEIVMRFKFRNAPCTDLAMR
jgi:hypothetical protein